MKSIFKNIRSLFNQCCLLCQAACEESQPFCDACFNDLPWLTHACHRCALPLPTTQLKHLCGHCLQRKRFALDSVQAAFHYQFPLNALIPKTKQLRFSYWHRGLSRALAYHLRRRPQAWPSVLIPVPLHRRRLLIRGYNQAEYLAHQLSTHLTLPLDTQSLVKIRPSPPQAGLSARERKRNLAGAFRYTGPAYPHVVIVDDVMTTGATLETIAATLKAGGVGRVDAWVLARTPAPQR